MRAVTRPRKRNTSTKAWDLSVAADLRRRADCSARHAGSMPSCLRGSQVNPSRQRLQCGAAAKSLGLAAACAAQARRLRGYGVQGIHDLHRIGIRKTRKVSATAARSTVQSRAPPETRSARGRGQLQIARRKDCIPNWLGVLASAQDGKAERTAASGRFGAAALSLRHAAALRHGSLCTAGAQGAALSIFRRR